MESPSLKFVGIGLHPMLKDDGLTGLDSSLLYHTVYSLAPLLPYSFDPLQQNFLVILPFHS